MTDCNGKEISKGAKVAIAGTILEMSPGNAGNDNVCVRTEIIDPITKAPKDLHLNAKQVEVRGE